MYSSLYIFEKFFLIVGSRQRRLILLQQYILFTSKYCHHKQYTDTLNQLMCINVWKFADRHKIIHVQRYAYLFPRLLHPLTTVVLTCQTFLIVAIAFERWTTLSAKVTGTSCIYTILRKYNIRKILRKIWQLAFSHAKLSLSLSLPLKGFFQIKFRPFQMR